jgi:hypothetical protein
MEPASFVYHAPRIVDEAIRTPGAVIPLSITPQRLKALHEKRNKR